MGLILFKKITTGATNERTNKLVDAFAWNPPYGWGKLYAQQTPMRYDGRTDRPSKPSYTPQPCWGWGTTGGGNKLIVYSLDVILFVLFCSRLKLF